MKILKLFKNSIYFLFSLIIFFIIINLLISSSWYIYSKYKAKSFNLFPKEVRNNFNLSDEEQKLLYNESQKIRYTFEPFLGPITDNFSGKFTNYNKKTGRFIKNKDGCIKNIFFFGGSTTFGWLSTDKKTIPSQFKDILNDDNYCVYNFGQPWFYSKQENNYLIKLIEENFKPDYAIFIDGINERCKGHALESFIISEFQDLNVEHRTFIFVTKFKNFFNSLPFFQLALRLANETDFRAAGDVYKCSNDNELTNLFENRLKHRMEICSLHGVNCLSFLQPFGLINGNIYFTNDQDVKTMTDKYNQLKKAKGIIDISLILDGKSEKISYVDGVHYSHESNRIIAEEIFRNIFK